MFEMKEIIIATHNSHKVEEIKPLLEPAFKVVSLGDLGFDSDIPETGLTLKENARQKARCIWDKYGKDCFADDTGLMVEALDGAPGVYSARFAGEGCSFEDNINLLLEKMKGKSNRKACFATVICLVQDGEEMFFEGRCEGTILEQRRGGEGFGYDPVFLPEGSKESFAQMSMEDKNRISHRGIATSKLVEYLLNR